MSDRMYIRRSSVFIRVEVKSKAGYGLMKQQFLPLMQTYTVWGHPLRQRFVHALFAGTGCLSYRQL
ncbi:hypothetical protein [Halalkalibacter oceani]|uniref:Uncharacterized protein n=1 Tax=Halalkalibacter oceani TaxID=1653776 RepID=A0A9X2DNF2_9BACI|nr:hypothetical protein [Halalkalibacter oceani]MCM3714129.1 hypothetical protein [Halalkalibacter oceani]